MKLLALACVAACVAGCTSSPQAPDWQNTAHAALGGFEKAYLAGDRGAEAEFARARAALSSTGRADLVARAELTRCAVRVASLEFDECPGYALLSADTGATERAYAQYIGGRWQGMDAGLLPAHHRGIATGQTPALAGVDEPLARLVAAGALMRAGRIDPAGIALAVDTSSAQGWRRPLLAWLGVQLRRAQAAGDAQAVEGLRRRIDLVAATQRKP